MKQRRLARPFAIKSITDSGTFTGYGSVFGVTDSYGDVVEPGAFKKSLAAWHEKGALPAMLWQHRAADPIGVWTAMEEDDRGLLVEGEILLEAGALERRAYAHLRAGSVRGLSIGYAVPAGGEEFDEEAAVNRLKEIDLWEVSPVTFPANPAAEVDAVKAAIEAGPKQVERLLREAGLSRNQAKGLLARGWEGLRALREAGELENDLAEAIRRNIDILRG